jgi:hypothetical protein
MESHVAALASRSDTVFSILPSLSYMKPYREPVDIHCWCPNFNNLPLGNIKCRLGKSTRNKSLDE